MLLTITATTPPATDLGFLLHKHPDRMHERAMGFGTARVVFPEATADRCTAALLVDVDPVGLVRRGGGAGLDQYVNDRPYVASSLLSVALGKVFGTALRGRSEDRPELAARAQPLEARLPVVPARGDEDLIRALLEPLGYTVEAAPVPLDDAFPGTGGSGYLDVTLRGEVRLAALLEHLVVLLPVLDDAKHYWVGPDEVDKLLARGGAWLAAHPQRELITRRYLRHDRRLADEALARLCADEPADPEAEHVAQDAEEAALERPVRLADLRLAAVVAVLRDAGAREVLDLGCGQGRLVGALLAEPWVARVVGVEVSTRALQAAARRLRLDEMAPRQRARVDLLQGALTYRDARLRGFDAAALVEVVEHVDPARLGALAAAVFGDARPATVVLTTPNRDYNDLFDGLPAGTLRHRDHRFEWTRAERAAWAGAVADRYGYRLALDGVGPVDPARGAPTQLAVFRR